jgi:ubiquinol-cytochrome c reductase cytochrome b subunit
MKLGACHVETPFIELGQFSSVLYFSYFIFILPVISIVENTLIDVSANSTNKSISNELTEGRNFK